MGHIPVGMEMFSAADEEQWKIIARQIDQSDYYAVIVAHRYGSLAGGVSYTEKEYDYAVQQGVPVIGFLIQSEAAWPADRMETDPKKKKLLDQFKARIKAKPVGFWSNAEELHGKFSIALMKLFNTNPRPGWVRASEVAGPDVLAELSRLSSENATMRERLENSSSRGAEYLGLSFQELCDELIAIDIQCHEPQVYSNSIQAAMTFGNAAMAFENLMPSLLHFFWIFSGWFSRGKPFGQMEKSVSSELSQLIDLGLISSNQFTIYSLTEPGRRFLMRLRAEHNSSEERGCIISADV